MIPSLWAHQQRALEYAQDKARIALFMEMRLGKSRVAIQWSMARCHARVLLICPLSATADWVDELVRHGIRPTQLYNQTLKAREELAYGGSSGWYLINYESLRITPTIAELPWDAVIADESTRFRNPKAQITKTMNRVFHHVPDRAILSGLPNPESELDYFEQLRFLHGSFCGFRNFWAFRNVKFHQDRWDWLPDPGTRDLIKNEVDRCAFVLTRKQAGLGETAIYKTRVVAMTPEQKKAYAEVFTAFSYEELKTNYATVRDVWLARLAGGFSPDRDNPRLISDAKTREIIDLLKGDLKGQQVVIFFRFNEELHHVVASIHKAFGSHTRQHLRVATITGSTSPAERRDIQQDFRAGRVQILCAQILVAKYGIDLSAASTAIYYSNSYEYEARDQSRNRIIHVEKITRKESILYIDLITEHTLDRDVVQSLKEKGMNARLFNQRLTQVIREEWERYGQGASRQKTPAPQGQGGGTQTAASTASARRRPSRVFPRAAQIHDA